MYYKSKSNYILLIKFENIAFSFILLRNFKAIFSLSAITVLAVVIISLVRDIFPSASCCAKNLLS